MSVFTRGRRPTLGNQYAEVIGEGLGILLQGNPLSYQYQAPKIGGSPRNLALYLIAKQRQQYDKTILDQIDERILRRHVKLLLEKYTPEQIVRGIGIAGRLSHHPFSFSMVERQLQHVRLRPDSSQSKNAPNSCTLRTTNRQKLSVSVARRQGETQCSAF